MRYEHLIQVNDILGAAIAPISRAALWQGLVRRAEDPILFIYGLERAVITDRGSDAAGVRTLTRKLDFGPFTVDDTVTLTPDREVVTEVPRTERWPACRMTIRVEEPEQESLFLRFIYEWSGDFPGGDEMVTDMQKQAYQAADLDTVVRIRELAGS